MTLGILSDTHGYFHSALPEALANVDLILHAGDVGDPAILDRLQEIAPVHAVWGNIDGAPIRRIAPEHQRIDAEQLSIWMTHIGGSPGRWAPHVKKELMHSPPSLFICGHSHILRIERVHSLGGMLYINPGAAGLQGFHQVKTCVRLHVRDGAAVQAEVVEMD